MTARRQLQDETNRPVRRLGLASALLSLLSLLLLEGLWVILPQPRSLLGRFASGFGVAAMVFVLAFAAGLAWAKRARRASRNTSE